MPINTPPVNNEEEKVNKFYTAINHYAMEQRKKIEHEIAEFKSKELEEAENEVLAEAYHLIQKEMAQMRGGISREMEKGKLTVGAGCWNSAKKSQMRFLNRLRKHCCNIPGQIVTPPCYRNWRKKSPSFYSKRNATSSSST